ncbi:hypothetical protein [Variovorax sp. DXTD-1]|uniref:hypothetical protein n=1 Tax=Variovorax sp. DXTD-1 TaxID=2495592 RepID=UPI000F87CBE8|nr:hypothetical protein [Variovorax sp. DXTD-1]RST46981.1 hypothetical protein EJI00_20555 [Variovorax sp. DXTD-1]
MVEILVGIVCLVAAFLFFTTPRKGSLAQLQIDERAKEIAFRASPAGDELTQYRREQVDGYSVWWERTKNRAYTLDPNRWDGLQPMKFPRDWAVEWPDLERAKLHELMKAAESKVENSVRTP